jgi:hypothetical protein
MRGNLKQHMFPILAGALLLVTSIVAGATISGQNATLAAQQSTLEGVQTEVEAAHNATRDLNADLSLASLGADTERVSRDSKVIGELAAQALAWDSHATYVEARASTMRLYGLSADSAFMTSFLPESPVNIDAEGNEYPYIDAAGLNSRVGDLTVKVLAVDGVAYKYMALVDVQSESSDQIGVAVNVATIFITINGDGSTAEISGFASTTPNVTSG